MSTRKSLFFSFLDRYASLAISVGSSMVIARLLTPAEIGVFSVTMVLLTLVASVRDMGAGQYLVQERELTTERIRAVWAVQLGLGVGLACVVVLASYPVSLFYKEPRMRDIMLVIALNYAINPFGSLTYAWLMREMRFESVALMRFSSALLGALVSMVLAWNGHGPISLAFGSLTATVVGALMASHYRPKSFPWMPGLGEVRRVLSFGSKLTVSSIIGVVSGGAPELLLGKLQNLTAAGLYSRSNGLVQMFNRLVIDAVGSVCLPWFAKQSREEGDFIAPFLKATAYVTVVGWSFCVVIICLAHPIVRVLYGTQWDQSVDLARYLSVAIAFSVPASLCNIALLSSGAVAKIARLTIVNALQTVALVALGASQGLVALSLAVIVSAAISAANALQVTGKHLKLPLRGLLHAVRLSGQVALLTAVGPVLVVSEFGLYPETSLLPLALGGVSALLGFVAGVMLFKHPLQEELLSIWARIKR
ncbi:Membrane protein involved in the export of O-antigen and teichoic acid [Rhodoferax sp. OV413]|uniref:lipopolysaccharide biosynthesis protein n=1 Tax=Rhodoferax sp. OV413 TaxID=1855285 RepID=UPI0008877CC8|nr:lipopolysaccharide biosynthesis protein [Rhodoferax sp. OV413]SDP90477.1 Membrane protein involved in the export of O-antigen and teichoic acid [Rhodoferax sp. OV413]